MERDSFEQMVEKALEQLTTSMVDAPPMKRRGKKGGIKNVCYGTKEKLVGQAVARLAASGRSNKPISAPDPSLVPPCF